jgi:hypothetical protein
MYSKQKRTEIDIHLRNFPCRYPYLKEVFSQHLPWAFLTALLNLPLEHVKESEEIELDPREQSGKKNYQIKAGDFVNLQD